jgi:hypothetical protein
LLFSDATIVDDITIVGLRALSLAALSEASAAH